MGGSPSIPQRNLPRELDKIFKHGVPQDLKGYNNFWQGEPLLSGAHDFALGNLQNIGSLINPLQKLYGQLPGQVGNIAGQVGNVAGQVGDLASLFPGFRSQVEGFQGQLGDLSGDLGGYKGQLGGLNDRLGSLYRNLPSTTGLTGNLHRALVGLPDPSQLTGQLRQRLGQLGNVFNTQIEPGLMSGGALNPEQSRDVDQSTRAAFAARGNVMGNQALGTELLNRDQYRRQRFNELLGQGLGISGEQRGLTSGIENVFDQNAAARLGLAQGIEGINSQDLSNRLGITQGQSALLGQQAGITGQQAGITGQQAGLTGLLGQLTGQQGNILGQQGNLLGQQAGLLGSQAGLASGLASGIQGLQQGGINQALGVEQGQVGSWASIINPLLSYGQDVASSNQNAAAAQNIAGGNKTQGAIGGGLSILGSVAAAY
jgi:hypothetical protein